MTNWCALVLLELGLAAFDADNNVIVSNRFTNPAQSLRSIKSGMIPKELEELIEALYDFNDISVNDSNLNELLRAAGLKTHMMTLQEQDEIQNQKQMLLIRYGFVSNERDAVQKIRNFAIEISSSMVKE